jgi:hypothetical protein
LRHGRLTRPGNIFSGPGKNEAQPDSKNLAGLPEPCYTRNGHGSGIFHLFCFAKEILMTADVTKSTYP